MKKTTFTILTAFILSISLNAQTIQEGMNHLYAQRYKSAAGVFLKMLAVNPNDMDATYWLGQTYLDQDEIMSSRITGAKQLYEKAKQASNNHPLIEVGLGHVALLEGKMDEARQHFESALTSTRGKKGDDPKIETAIGRAIADSKNGDFNYAIRLLEDASAKDPKNTETYLQLGNAYRKAGEGSGGGQAFQSYKKALEVSPTFSVANYRIAQIFASQKNWEPYLQYLNEAIAKDSKFTPAYYELFYYYWFNKMDYPEAERQLNKFIESKLPESDIQDQFLYAQLSWGKKDYATAVQKGESVVAEMGEKTKPKVYRLLADAYNSKGDFASAKKYSDLFFLKKNPEDITLYDYQLRADILGKSGGTDDEVVNTYMEALTVDTLVNLKTDLLKKGITYFKDKKVPAKQIVLINKIIEMKPTPSINDQFDLMKAYYDIDSNARSRAIAVQMREKYPDQVFGYQWAFNNARILDSVKMDSIAVPDAISYNEFSQKDTVKFRSQYITSLRFLSDYYINKARDKDKALVYFQKWHDIDTANAAQIQGLIDQIKKMPVKPNTPARGTTAPRTGTGSLPKPAATSKSKTTATTTKKTVVKNK